MLFYSVVSVFSVLCQFETRLQLKDSINRYEYENVSFCIHILCYGAVYSVTIHE